ncbi:hypothetical protein B0H12DRAFT_1076284 [Mycena haematopus]|nr:hypothetical protein B0H12DRAFT_1076284 [Mycena haematopus]
MAIKLPFLLPPSSTSHIASSGAFLFSSVYHRRMLDPTNLPVQFWHATLDDLGRQARCARHVQWPQSCAEDGGSVPVRGDTLGIYIAAVHHGKRVTLRNLIQARYSETLDVILSEHLDSVSPASYDHRVHVKWHMSSRTVKLYVKPYARCGGRVVSETTILRRGNSVTSQEFKYWFEQKKLVKDDRKPIEPPPNLHLLIIDESYRYGYIGLRQCPTIHEGSGFPGNFEPRMSEFPEKTFGLSVPFEMFNFRSWATAHHVQCPFDKISNSNLELFK